MTRRSTTALRWALPCLLVTASALALAHTGNDGEAHHGMGEALQAGFIHPLSGLDHLCAMLSIGVWSALAMRRIWLAPFVFASTLLVGALLGFAGLALPAVEPMVAASLVVLGLLVVVRADLPTALGLGIVALFALFHGAAHGQELGGPFGGWALVGMVTATALLHCAGIALGLAMQRSRGWLPRAAGGLVALVGICLLVPVLAGAA